jgi:hypothetical protein
VLGVLIALPEQLSYNTGIAIYVCELAQNSSGPKVLSRILQKPYSFRATLPAAKGARRICSLVRGSSYAVLGLLSASSEQK